MAKLTDFLFGKSPKMKNVSTLNPQQQELMGLITQGLKSGTGAFGDLFGSFNEKRFQEGVTNPALKNFKENILPVIQEKFIGQGALRSSGFQNATSKAGSDLQAQLAQLMYQAQQQQGQNQLQGIQTALQPQQQQLSFPGTRGFLGDLYSGLAPTLGKSGGGIQGLLQQLLGRGQGNPGLGSASGFGGGNPGLGFNSGGVQTISG